jgi:hypothetical protein
MQAASRRARPRDRGSRRAHATVTRIRNFAPTAGVSTSTRLKGETSMSMKLMITAAALVAALAGPALAGSHANGTKSRAIRDLQRTTARASVERTFDADARPYDTPTPFGGYPTDYLMNRFGDRQMQGR